MPAIELSGLSKSYGDVAALRDLDLVVEEGEIFGFLGPNGAGKSTTIDILLDFVRPSGGSASVLGLDSRTDSQAVRRRTGVLPDAYHVYDRLTGREHVEFAIASKGVSDDADALLSRVGILESADRPAGDYSKGMRQRLVLAMALVGEPDLLILDEPTTGLDPSGAREMRQIIREERARGATVFFSSHILEQVEAVCDRVAILNAGELVTVDTIAGLRSALGSEGQLDITVDAVPADVTAVLEGVSGVSTVRVDGRTIAVGSSNGSKVAIIDAIESMGAEIIDFTTSEASLEDLFIAYTSGEGTPSTGPTAESETAPEADSQHVEVDR